MTFSRLTTTIIKNITKQIATPQCYHKNKDIVLSKNRIAITYPRHNVIMNRPKQTKQF